MLQRTSISVKFAYVIFVNQGFTLLYHCYITDVIDCFKPRNNHVLTILSCTFTYGMNTCCFMPMWDLFSTFCIRLVPYETLDVPIYIVLQ